MYGNNEIVGQKFFREHKQAKEGKLLVTSIFSTLQGEGPFAGKPAAFVRLAHCQLACHFCDTYFDSGDWYDPDSLSDKLSLMNSSLLVVTGGEPTLQGPALRELCRHALARFDWVQIETNGLLAVDVPQAVVVVVSPKCRDGVYSRLLSSVLDRADCLKFIVSGDLESPYSKIPDWALSWRDTTRREIFISPMAEYLRTPEQARAIYEARRKPSLSERVEAERVSFWEPGLFNMEKCRCNYEYAAALVMRHGLRLSIQMHLFANLP